MRNPSGIFFVLALLAASQASSASAQAAGATPAKLDPAQLFPFVEAFVQEPDSPWQGFEVQGLAVELPRPLPAMDEPLQVDLEVRSSTASSLLLFARISAPGAKTQEVWLRVRGTLYAEIAVAAKPVARGQALAPEDVRLDRRRLTRLNPVPLQDAQQLEGLQARRALSSGSVLAPADFEAVQMVLRGDLVRLVAEGSHFRVSIQAQALESGVRGKRIRLKNLSSGKILVAEVSAPGEAILRLP